MPCTVVSSSASACRTASSNGRGSIENSGAPASTTASSSTWTSTTSPDTRGAICTTCAETTPRPEDGASRSPTA